MRSLCTSVVDEVQIVTIKDTEKEVANAEWVLGHIKDRNRNGNPP
jgi:hypothetical protein